MAHDDELYRRAVDLVITRQSASISMVQRTLRIGFAQADSYFDEMQAMGIVSAPNSLGGRTVLVKDETDGNPAATESSGDNRGSEAQDSNAQPADALLKARVP